MVDYVKTIKKDHYKIVAYLLIFFLVLSPFGALANAIPVVKNIPIINKDGLLISYAKNTYSQAQFIGPSYNIQWQVAMNWVRENTPKDAVFAHWWDYGYWVQTGGERATLSDGGNARGAINHFIGRHVLTAQNETEALEFLKANDATHLLIISDEIGKYAAFSSIGADENYDRYSWIPSFNLNPSQSRETRNGSIYAYTGGTALDDNFIYQEQLYPAGAAGIAGFFLPVTTVDVVEGNKTRKEPRFSQPQAILVYNGQQKTVPLKCLYVNKEKIEYDGETLPGCLVVIPVIQGGTGNAVGAALYLSNDVRISLFSSLYIFNDPSDYFKLAYNDEQQIPLSVRNGRVSGPLKIWEVSYPDDLIIPPEYYGTTLPNPRVNDVRR